MAGGAHLFYSNGLALPLVRQTCKRAQSLILKKKIPKVLISIQGELVTNQTGNIDDFLGVYIDMMGQVLE